MGTVWATKLITNLLEYISVPWEPLTLLLCGCKKHCHLGDKKIFLTLFNNLQLKGRIDLILNN